MNPQINPLNNPLIATNFSRKFCIKCISKRNKKCKSFYEKISTEYYDDVKTNLCPYKYTVITFADQVSNSVITSDSDISKIKKRDLYSLKYTKKENKKNFIDTYELFNEENIELYKKYTIIHKEYQKYSRFFHDISNSISFFLDIDAKKIGISNETLSNGYIDINKLLLDIKNIKSTTLSKFNYSIDYMIQLEKLRNLYRELIDKIKNCYVEAEKIQLVENTLNFISGFGLFKTLSDYYDRLDNKNGDFTISIHKPHKMLKKLSRMLEHKANKKSIEINFSRQSHSNDCYVSNISDIYIAFFSILENAIKYALVGTGVQIDISDIDDGCIIKISNQCENLNIEDIDKLTSFGYRGSNTKSDSQSSGFGLYLVDEIFKKGNIKYKINGCLQNFFEVEVELKSINRS